jgi:hypothetical protein
MAPLQSYNFKISFFPQNFSDSDSYDEIESGSESRRIVNEDPDPKKVGFPKSFFYSVFQPTRGHPPSSLRWDKGS